MKIVVLIMALVVSGAAIAAPELKGDPDELARYLLDAKKIVINGEGEERGEADSAVISLAVKTKDSHLRQAIEDNEKIRKAITAKLQSAGIPGDKIKSSRFSSTPNYGWFGDKPTSYDITNEVKITVTDETQLRAVADIVDTYKESRLIKTDFEYSAKESAKIKALEKAISNVLAKRSLYERTLNITLTPINVAEHSYAATPAPLMLAPRKAIASGAESLSSFSAGGTGSADAASGGFGEVVYKANSTVEFVSKQN